MDQKVQLKFYVIVFYRVILAITLIFPLVSMSATADDSIPEYRIKVAFLYNFLKFVDWPGDASPKKTGKAKVCIIGDSNFAEYLNKLQINKPQDITITVNSLAADSNTASCHILLIGKTEEERAVFILAHTKQHPILSISEATNFADNGGIIEIVRVGQNVGLFSKDKINLRINLKVAEASDLRIDARLLQIAAEVIKP